MLKTYLFSLKSGFIVKKKIGVLKENILIFSWKILAKVPKSQLHTAYDKEIKMFGQFFSSSSGSSLPGRCYKLHSFSSLPWLLQDIPSQFCSFPGISHLCNLNSTVPQCSRSLGKPQRLLIWGSNSVMLSAENPPTSAELLRQLLHPFVREVVLHSAIYGGQG